MRRRPGFRLTTWLLASLAAAGLVTLAGASSAQASIGIFACHHFVGTYLVTNPDEDGEEGDIDSRSLLTFFADGNFLFIDSNQDGEEGAFNPFTDAAGHWTCDRHGWPRTASAVALDFTLPGSEGPDQLIARLDFFGVTVDYTGHIEGSATLRFFPLDAGPSNPPDPLDPDPNDTEPFEFFGERVKGPAQEP